ncbi:Rv3654c family TadE-like protein [Pseudonocardia sp.]|uniref:Rv3654c family TadE-like protein n=1 Tax=Pseudonocardia sp. TaxID=60912 RepID=UPI003D0C0754
MTVEAAIALGVLVMVTLAATGAILAVVAAVRCTDAAREAARLAARGEPERGRAVAARLAPPDATVEIGEQGEDVVVSVTAPTVRPFPFRVSARAVAATEPAGPDPAPAGVGTAVAAVALGSRPVRRRTAAERARRSDDSGVATAYAALAAVLVLGLAAVGIDLGGAVLARHRAEAAADLAALAAASDAALGVEAACAHARAITAGMDSVLRRCVLDGWDAMVEVGTPRAAVFGNADAVGRARAGPAEPP